MSAPESTVAVPVVEEVASPETPAVEAVESKVEESAAVAEGVTPAVEAEVPTEDTPKEVKAEGEAKKDVPKSPNFLSKLLSGFKVGEKKPKAPKSPKKEKKKEEVEAPATEEAPKEVPEVPAEVVETVKEEAEPVATEAAAAPEVAAAVPEEVKETPVVQKVEAKTLKVGRRLSARVGDFFKSKPKAEVTTPAKVDEHPPKIDEPVPVAPLENPASEAAKVEEPSKLVETAAPVVAATA